MLDWRLKAFEIWNKMKEPEWAKVNYPKMLEFLKGQARKT